MRKLAVALILAALSACVPFKALAKTTTVAVIDTGIDASNPKLCKSGHKSFIDNQPLVDHHGHGTHVAGLIVREAGDLNYCLVAIKYYSVKNTGAQNLANLIKAMDYLINIKIDYINISGGGPEFNETEYLAFEKALNSKIKIFAAAGNEKDDLDKSCNYFPACYDKRIVMVGNLEVGADYRNMDNDWKFLAMIAGMGNKLETYETRRSPSSNYGKRVTQWEVGTDQKSSLPGGKTGYMSGTSQATGVATGKALKARLSK